MFDRVKCTPMSSYWSSTWSQWIVDYWHISAVCNVFWRKWSWHKDILLFKLKRRNVRVENSQLFKSYLGHASPSRFCRISVTIKRFPQGSTLASLLFRVFMNNFLTAMKGAIGKHFSYDAITFDQGSFFTDSDTNIYVKVLLSKHQWNTSVRQRLLHCGLVMLGVEWSVVDIFYESTHLSSSQGLTMFSQWVSILW